MTRKTNDKFKALILALIVVLGIWYAVGLVDSKGDATNSATRKTNKTETNLKKQSEKDEESKNALAKESEEESANAAAQDTKSEKASEYSSVGEEYVKKGLLEEVYDNSGEFAGWESKAGLFYGLGSKEGTRLEHVFEHLRPNHKKRIHSVFTTNEEGLIRLIDKAWLKRDEESSKKQSNGNRVYDVYMDRIIGTEGEETIRIVVRDKSAKLITAYPRR